MALIKDKKSLFSIFIFLSLGLQAQQTEIIDHNGALRITVPTTNGVQPPAVVSKRNYSDGGSQLFFALGSAAENITKNQKPNVNQKLNLQLSDLALIADLNGRIIGAAYPLVPQSEIFVTALHLLKGSQFLNPKLSSYQYVGFINPNTGSLYDIAFLMPPHLTVIDILNHINSDIDLSKNIIAQHLNLVDKGYETTFSRSVPIVSSYNNDYIFLRNNEKSFLGPSSSGAIVYSEDENQPLGLIVCASRIINNEQSIVIRALKLSRLHNAKSVNLDSSIINSFETLPCDVYDGRRAGGD